MRAERVRRDNGLRRARRARTAPPLPGARSGGSPGRGGGPPLRPARALAGTRATARARARLWGTASLVQLLGESRHLAPGGL
eukprot:13009347-Alexandrium_andersonii.AAC.1